MTQTAKSYGSALYELAKDEGASRQILNQLTVLSEAFAAQPRFIQLMSTPSISKQERLQIIDDSFRGKIHPYVLNFLKLLTQRGYAGEFTQCCRVFRSRYDRDNSIVSVTAVTAAPLSDAMRAGLRGKLSQVTGKNIALSCRVDPKVLGGVRLDFDGRQVDGTLRRRLDDIRGILKNTLL